MISEAADIWVPLLAASLGMLPYFLERHRRQRIEDNQRRRAWAEISKIQGLMSDIERDGEPGSGALQAIGKLSIILRDLLHEACTLEPKLNYAVVQKWRASGRLASDWQEQLVVQLLHDDEIPATAVDRLRALYGDGDELAEAHPMSARREDQQ